MQLIFATNNPHKLEEIRVLLGGNFKIVGFADLALTENIPEDHDTLEGNASQKAWYIYNRTGKNCFADDTGLEVEALRGAPGVYSARYSRMGNLVFPDLEPAIGNVKKLLHEMDGMNDRRARFRTVIALVIDGVEYLFEGEIGGEITTEPSGALGFGYDPVFSPDGHRETFASMKLSDKNLISHRARAGQKLAHFLNGM